MRPYLLTAVFLVTSFINLFPCTIFNISQGETTFIGNNEDWLHRDSYITFIPATGDKYGRIFVGFGKNCKYRFGGINDQGLFYDIASLTKRDDINFDSKKETVDNPVYEKMLETCSNIEEAIDFISQYNINGFKRHHIMIVDKTGNSAILEWGTDSLSVIMKNNNYQIMTNFNNTNPDLAGWYPCRRFEKVEQELHSSEHFSIEKIRLILESVQNRSSNYPTVYSNIYDQENNFMYLYNYHNFEEYCKVDLVEELKNGEHSYYMPSLFSDLKLFRPLNSEKISSDSVDFIWQGNADEYILSISTNSDFEDCKKIRIANNQIKSDSNINVNFIFLGLIPFLIFTYKRKKELILLSLVLFFSICLTQCTHKSNTDNTESYSHTFSNLDENKTYHWKIETIKDKVILTSSITKQFTTNGLKDNVTEDYK